MKNRSTKFDDPRLILPRTPEFTAAVDRLAEVIKSPDSVPNGFDEAMASDTFRRAQRTSIRILEMASELGLVGVSIDRGLSDDAPAADVIVLYDPEEEA